MVAPATIARACNFRNTSDLRVCRARLRDLGVIEVESIGLRPTSPVRCRPVTTLTAKQEEELGCYVGEVIGSRQLDREALGVLNEVAIDTSAIAALVELGVRTKAGDMKAEAAKALSAILLMDAERDGNSRVLAASIVAVSKIAKKKKVSRPMSLLRKIALTPDDHSEVRTLLANPERWENGVYEAIAESVDGVSIATGR